jgi:translocation and assembly module TamB
VKIKAMGFEGRVHGSLLITEQTGRPTSAAGEIVIEEGTYKAYGTDLTIERGSIRFAGPLNNPGLDLKASRKAQDGTVAGATVKGSFKSPEVQVYSEPPMAQSEALAYLILGHPLGEATPAEGNLVANAATSLGIKAGNLLGKQVAKKFGLETARIETTNGQLEQASLVVGKYLSPKLYIEYGLGIFDQVSRLRINYILNKKWTLRAETGQENGADVLYTLEK